MDAERQLSPKDVAKILNIGGAAARRLMATGEIRSFDRNEKKGGRQYLVTVIREIQAYHERKLQAAHQQKQVTRVRAQAPVIKKGELSKIPTKDFLRTL